MYSIRSISHWQDDSIVCIHIDDGNPTAVGVDNISSSSSHVTSTCSIQFKQWQILTLAHRGQLCFYIGSTNAPIARLAGFGPIVSVIQLTQLQKSIDPIPLNRAESGASASSPRSCNTSTAAPPLLIVNAAGELFVLELSEQFWLQRITARRKREEQLATSADDAESASSSDPVIVDAETIDEPGGAAADPLVDEEELITAAATPFWSSPFVSAHHRYRIPLNVSAVHCLPSSSLSGASSAIDIILGTLDRSLHQYSLFWESDAPESIPDKNEIAVVEGSYEDERRNINTNPLSHSSSSSALLGSATNTTGGATIYSSRRASPFTVAPSSSALQNITPPILHSLQQQSSSSSNSAPGDGTASTTQSAVSSRTGSPAFKAATALLSDSRPRTPILGLPARTASSSLTSSSSILSSINSQQQREQTATSPQLSSSFTRPVSIPAASLSSASLPHATYHLRFELRAQFLHLPLPVFSLSSVGSSNNNQQAAAMFQQLKPQQNVDEDIQSGTSSLTLPSNAVGLLPIRSATATTSAVEGSSSSVETWHVLPSYHFQRVKPSVNTDTIAVTAAGSIQHQRMNTAGGIVPHAASNSNLPNLHGSNPVHHHSLKDIPLHAGGSSPPIVPTAPGGLSRSITAVSRPFGSGAAGVGSLPPSGSNPGSRKHSGATPQAAMVGVASFHSPSFQSHGNNSTTTVAASPTHTGLSSAFFQSSQFLAGSGLPPPSSSPKLVPSAGHSYSGASPRFSFIQNQQTQGHHPAQLYSNSITSSPVIISSSQQPHQRDGSYSSSKDLPAFSLGMSAAEIEQQQAIANAPVTMLSVSPTLLLVSLDEGVLLVDIINHWLYLLSFPHPSSMFAPLSPSMQDRRLPVSSSSISLVSNPSSATQPPTHPAASITQQRHPPPAGNALGSSFLVPPLQRTASAPGIVGLVNPQDPMSPTATSETPFSPPSQSPTVGSTPMLRPTPSTNIPIARDLIRRQVSGGNLSALNETTAPSSVLQSPQRILLTNAGEGSVNTNVVVNSSAGETPLFSPAATPQPQSIENSRNVSYAALPNLAATPIHGPMIHNNSTISQQQQFINYQQWDIMRADVIGNVRIPINDNDSNSQCRPSGVLASLDSLGHFTVQHVTRQLEPATTILPVSPSSSSTVASSKLSSKWYDFSLLLAGQFLKLLTFPNSACESVADEGKDPPAADDVLIACSLDGSIYLIPSLPFELPASPSIAPTSVPTSPSSLSTTFPQAAVATAVSRHFLITRFQYPSRIQSCHTGSYSFSLLSAPVPCLFLTTFQNELIILTDIISQSGFDEWKHEWIWKLKEKESSTMNSAGGRNTIQHSQSSVSVNSVDVASDTHETSAPPDVIVAPPLYELSITSTPRSLLNDWNRGDNGEKDEARDSSDSTSSTSQFQSLLKWTNSAIVLPKNSVDSSSSVAPSQLPLYLRDLCSCDLTLLHAYREELLRELSLLEEDLYLRNRSRSVSPSSSTNELDVTTVIQTPTKRAAGHDAADEDDVEEDASIETFTKTLLDSGAGVPPTPPRPTTTIDSPVASHFSLLHSSPLFSPFNKLTSIQPPSFKLAADNSTASSESARATATKSTPTAATSSSSPAASAAAPLSSDQKGGSSFWRQLLRRSQ